MKTQPEKIEAIVLKGCEYLGIDRSKLLEHYSPKDPIWQKKRLLAYALQSNCILTLKDIGSLVGIKSHELVLYHCNAVKDELGDKFGVRKTKMIYEEMMRYIEQGL